MTPMRDPEDVIAGCLRDHAGSETSRGLARKIVAALRAEYGKAYASYRCIPVPLPPEATDA